MCIAMVRDRGFLFLFRLLVRSLSLVLADRGQLKLSVNVECGMWNVIERTEAV